MSVMRLCSVLLPSWRRRLRSSSGTEGPIVVVVVLLFASWSCAAFWDGIVSIDISNFDKVVTNDRNTLVKFDHRHPHGDEMDEWRNLATYVGERGASGAFLPFLLAEVNCHDEVWWNDRSYFNMDLARRFEVHFPSQYSAFRPVIKLFRRGEKKSPIDFYASEGTAVKITEVSLKRFLQIHLREVTFNLTGTVPRFSNIASTFVFLDSIEQMKQAKTKAENWIGDRFYVEFEDDQMAKFYVVVMSALVRAAEATKSKPARQPSVHHDRDVVESTSGESLQEDSFISVALATLKAEKMRIQKLLAKLKKSETSPGIKRKRVKVGSSEELDMVRKAKELEWKLNVLSTFNLQRPSCPTQQQRQSDEGSAHQGPIDGEL